MLSEARRLQLPATSAHAATLLADVTAAEGAAALPPRKLSVLQRLLSPFRDPAATLLLAIERGNVAEVSRELGALRVARRCALADLKRACAVAAELVRAAEGEEGIFDDRYKARSAPEGVSGRR